MQAPSPHCKWIGCLCFQVYTFSLASRRIVLSCLALSLVLCHYKWFDCLCFQVDTLSLVSSRVVLFCLVLSLVLCCVVCAELCCVLLCDVLRCVVLCVLYFLRAGLSLSLCLLPPSSRKSFVVVVVVVVDASSLESLSGEPHLRKAKAKSVFYVIVPCSFGI